MIDVTEKQVVVLRALREKPLTADEFVTGRGWYVNSWAPSFTELRKAGLIERTGERRATAHGALAHVVRLTAEGERALLVGVR